MKPTFKLIVLFVCASFYSATLSAQECNILYITPTGASSGVAGTRANPANLSYGLALASSTYNLLWLATGTYPISNSVMIHSNITIEGGFNSSTWIKSNVSQSVIDKDNTNVLPSPFNALIAFAGNGVANFRLQDITVNVANAPGHGNSVYGIYLTGCSNYNITRCRITTGSGSSGLAGTNGASGLSGGNGSAGNPGNPNQNVLPGGIGGVGGGGANNGGNGSQSGFWKASNNSPGSPGLPVGCGGGGGTTGSGPSCSFLCGSCTDASPGGVGSNGQAGIDGTIGLIGISGAVALGYFVPGTAGITGTNGTTGCGGGGGGGGGGDQQTSNDGVGGSGGGGGGGGDGGMGGTGGMGGGSSFAVFLYNNGAGGIIQDCLLNPGIAGLGGIGGLGGNGATGGIGGAGGPGVCAQENGAAGGAGGIGGNGGNGGNGAPGVSIALSENGGTPISNLGIIAVPGSPPVINVTNKGCTNSEVVFSSATSGTWNFGSGALPATATGMGPFSVYYSTMARKNITFSGTVFTGYITIFQSPPPLPSINPANGTVTLGCPNTFSTSLTGNYYQWIFGNSASPDTVQGATMQTASNIYFFSPGTHKIYLYITTACCGKIRDSTTVTVTPSSNNVSLTALPLSICQGAPITFTASPSTFLGYNFFVNNNIVQNGTNNTYTTSALHPGDSIMVVGLAGTCFTNPSAVIKPVITPFPIVTLSSSDPDSTICAGGNVTFSAAPTGYTNYQFFNGTTSVQSGASATYSTITLAPGNSITVVATNSGCPSLPSNAKVTTVNITPVITLTSSDADNILCGTGQSVTFIASPAGFANYNFFNGGTSFQSGAGNTFTTSTLVSGTSISVIAASASGCVGQLSNAIVTTVNPIPNAWLGSSDPDNTICQNEPITFTSLPASYTSYKFFNNGNVVQNGPNNTYTTTLAPGNSITVIATNLGCSSPLSTAITVTIIPAAIVNAGNDISACINAPVITLTGFTPTGGTWTGTGIISPTGTFNPIIAGVGPHKLIYAFTNSNNCTGYDSLIAMVNALPVISSSPDSPSICSGSSVSLTASGATTYTWSPSSGLSASTGSAVTASPGVTTIYTIIGKSNSCADTTFATVVVKPLPTVNITGNTTIGSCESTVLSAFPTSGGTYAWGPLYNLTCNTCQSATVSPTATQDYYVLFTNQDGCKNSDTVTVKLDNIYNYFMPTGFSPNGDGVNDSLHVHGRGIESVSLTIYDRIGEKVFETIDIKKGWDGKLHDVEMNDGVFVYILEIIYCNGKTVKEQGSVTLVR